MSALARDFNNPKTAAIQLVNVSGKIDDEATYFVTITLEISDDDTPPNTRYCYVAREYTGPVDFTVTPDPVYMAIVPQLADNETVTVSVTGSGGAFSGNIQLLD